MIRSHHLPLAPPRDELPPELREDEERLDDDPPDDDEVVDLCRRGMVTVRDVWWPQWAQDVSTRLVPELEYVGLRMIVAPASRASPETKHTKRGDLYIWFMAFRPS